MQSFADQSNFILRRKIRPYVIGAAVAAVVSVGAVSWIVLAHDWRLLLSLEVGWIMIAVWIYVGMRYQLLWQDGAVVMKALGRPDVAIAPDEIIQIGMDTGPRMKLGGFNISAQRIKILAKEPEADTKSVYVSLGHFVAPDLLRLMQAIGAGRPDLIFVRQWIQKCDTTDRKP